MKLWIPILASLVVGLVIGLGIGRSRPSLHSGPSEVISENISSTAVEPSSSGAGSFRGGTPRFTRTDALAAPVDAIALLDRLKNTRIPAGSERVPALRRLVHHFELLADLGPVSVPPIRDFLARFEDVEYVIDRTALPSAGSISTAGEPDGAASTQPVKLAFLTPPSLRIGLIDVLRAVGGEAAERALLEVVTTSGRAIELFQAAQALQSISKNTHREPVLAAARELLANPPKIEHPGLLDENPREYLYSVLYTFGDLSFSTDVRHLLIAADGSVDRTTLRYLSTTAPENAIPALYAAYKDLRVTNLSERTTLAAQLLSHVGTNQQANEAFHEIVSDPESPAWVRTLSIQSLAGGRGGPFLSAMPSDPETLRSRIDLLDSLPDFEDEVLNRTIEETLGKLGNRLATISTTNPPPASFRFRAEGNSPP